MTLPRPEPGLVIRYSYLWESEAQRQLSEGRKDRPCAIILSITDQQNKQTVAVCAITHSAPVDPTIGIELPPQTASRLGLDEGPHWIIVSEINQFEWPGYDLRPIAEDTYSYGFLPPRLFDQVKNTILSIAEQGKLKSTKRD